MATLGRTTAFSEFAEQSDPDAHERDNRAIAEDGGLLLKIIVRDRDVIEALEEQGDSVSRDEYAAAALRIGVLALKHARGRIDADQIQREGEKMLQSMQSQLQEHAGKLHENLSGSLRAYFDPENGSFHQRIALLVKRDGELEQVLRRQVGVGESELAKTLLEHVGKQSPLFKLLNPEETAGLVSALRGTLEEELVRQREKVLSEFSLDNKQGALARLVEELTQTHGEFQEGLGKQIDQVVKQFSLDEESSALSRLVQNVSHAQRTITSEFSLDNETSALSRLARLLDQTRTVVHEQLTLDDESSALARLRKELLELIKSYETANREFQEEVKLSLGKLAARKEAAQRSTIHGVEFEDALCECLQQMAQNVGDVFQRVGSTTGMIRHCQKGDAVWTLGPETAAPGERIVIEAKESRSYQIADALKELEQAKQNRECQLGVFVFSTKTAPAMCEPIARYGAHIVVVWNAEDANSDIYLKCAMTMARALCVQRRTDRDEQKEDIEGMLRATAEVEKQAVKLDEIQKWSQTIKNNSDKIMDVVRIAKDSLDKQVAVLRDRIDGIRSSSNP